MNIKTDQTQEPPDLSIVIPTYNRREMLEEAINAFLGLLHCRYEVLVVDDGSTDDTKNYLETLKAPIRVFSQKHRGGNAARNLGLREARGRFVKFVDDDDWLIASMVDEQVNYLKLHEDTEVCYSGYGLMSCGREVQLVGRDPAVNFERLLIARFDGKWLIPPLAYTLRRNLAARFMWDEHLTSSQDTDFFLSIMLEQVKFGWLPGSVGWVRHDNTRERVSAMTSNRAEEMANNQLRMLRKLKFGLEENGRLSPILRRALAMRYYAIVSKRFLINGDRQALAEALLAVKQLDPGFRPAGRFFPLLANIFGYAAAIRLRELRTK